MPSPAVQPADLTHLAAWQGRQVTDLRLVGLPEHLRETARSGLALVPRRKIVGRQLATLTLRTAAADARRLRLLLARQGYPDATVAVSGQSEGRTGVELIFTVTPGPAVRYGRITIEGLPPQFAACRVDSMLAGPAEGRRFNEQALLDARQGLLHALQQDGYARPQVTLTITRPRPGIADALFVCRPGERFVYADLVIEGTTADLEPLVRRTVRLAPGTPFSPAVIADSRHHLRQLQLFRQVRLHADARDSNTLDLIAELRPRAMLTTEARVGTFTDNWLVVGAGLTHRNFWRRGRGLFIGAAYATHRRNAEMRTWWPALLTARSRTELRLQHEIQDEDSYRLDRTEASLFNLFTAWRHTSLRLGITVSQGVLADRSADPDAFASEVGLQTLLQGIWYRDTSDNPLEPSRGHRLTLQSEWSPPGFWTQTPFVSLRAFGSRYLPFLTESVLALRLDAGAAWPLGQARDLRPDRRWFAGGVSSMRGYRRRQLGPTDSDGNPIGGEVRLLCGGEVRVPVWSIVKAALFADGGQVWRRARDVNPADLEAAAGLGLLVGTPVGPARLDVARHLGRPAAGQPRTLLQFGIGHPF